ncbi:XrtN system VIT domain-containing protein [Pedobacter sp. MC2016-14]|uniref:XrtN system VIT domain-containing protein n=1 Tax=Pedobacter sp. MC2016-14 TaxID=2897327 RepID=UPI001E3B2387|nr:XrtN system VIT domain-containing protein [Pedobacter sp. MC2016-14]MCD0489103.1 XrtN system VIT domain-containing protein [Pedobacter sp. MC2016-14]
MKTKVIFKDWLTSVGIAFIAISAGIYTIADNNLTSLDQRFEFGLFFLNYGLTAVFTVMVLGNAVGLHGSKISKANIEYTILMLILWLISAFSLNREMNVFENSVTWLCVWICISCITLLLYLYKDHFPLYLKHLLALLLGISILLFTYYSLYLTPLYIVSAFAAIGLGISLHTYVTLYLAIITTVITFRLLKTHKTLLYSFLTGILAPAIYCAFFAISWHKTNTKINYILNHHALVKNTLPPWISISQELKKSFITERFIKADLVYKTANLGKSIFWGDFGLSTFDELKKHDPLVIISSLFGTKNNLGEREKIKILQSMYDSRHQAQERLWAGDKLKTANVISNVQIYPEYRLAYTEKTISIANLSKRAWNNQEAIYTFHLPEGSAVTSLSLWINNKEEKAILTSKAKADTAYKEIVGVEQHDPSVIHWQEGNKITVRVFPCTIAENRKFKIGITSPLKKTEGKLTYQNPYFEGPAAKSTSETVRIALSNTTSKFDLKDYHEVEKNIYERDRDYLPYWEISCQNIPLSTETFSFSGTSYKVKNLDKKYESFHPEKIYADLNSSWTDEEAVQLLELIKLKSVYVFSDKLTRLTPQNFNQIYSQLHEQNFSLMPVYKIKNPENALIISKSTMQSPSLGDLENSEFQKSLTHYFNHPTHIRIFDLGENLSPYLSALKEFRLLNYEHGNFKNLRQQLNTGLFLSNQENDNKTVISSAEMVIESIPNTSAGTAPDHLMRLYAYNDIMKKAGKNYFNQNYLQPEIIEEAKTAYVVSPVSSLIVLETQKDYERFNIEDSKNSLKNAAVKSSGAVPEPHEWMLIIMAVFVLAYLWKSNHDKVTA